MKQLVWSPSSINFGNKKKGESVTAESTLSITEGSALLTPGKISPLPGADYPVQIKNTEGNLHIHPAFSFAAARYYLTSAGTLTTDRDIAEIYLGNAAGEGLPFLPIPITLVITTPPGEIDPADPLTINYTSSAVLWVKVFFKVNDSPWFFYDTFNATGTFDMDISELGFSHGDILTIKVQDDESTSFYDTVTFEVMVKNIVIDGIGTLYLIGEFEDGVDYYALPNGDITTDITGIYLGVGNADGDIDLNIIEYAVEISSPVASADIALDVPFTFEATTNVQDGRSLTVVAYSAEVPSGVALGVYKISGGAISGSVTVSESDGFTTGAVQLLAWYSPVVSTIDTVDVTAHTATITNVTSTPESPTEATYFELGGDSAYLVGKTLTLQYSTDDSTWLSLGVATVQPDGTWSKVDCQIADAGNYYLRAVYDTDKVESASVSVTVASGSLKIQILSENVVFITTDACVVSSNLIAYSGYCQNYGLNPKIGGLEFSSGGATLNPVCFLYDISAKETKWIKSIASNVTAIPLGCTSISSDGTHVWWMHSYNGIKVGKIAVSDGTMTTANTTIQSTTSPNWAHFSSAYDNGTYIFVAGQHGSDKRDFRAVRITKSDMTVGSLTALAFNPQEWGDSKKINVSGDGTYIYWGTQVIDARWRVGVLRSDTSIANQTMVAVYDDGGDATGSVYSCMISNATKQYIASNSFSSATYNVTDGTNNSTLATSSLCFANSILFGFSGKKVYKFSSTLGTDFNKDYDADAVAGTVKILYAGTNYYMVGRTTGNFDGNNPDNTKSCAIIGKIDIDTGAI